MELKGTVLNVVDFGAFVDIGLKDSGLVHISQLANRYIKSPHDMVSVGDVVTVWVMAVDHERKRVSLTMVKPGTERQRGQQAGGRRGGGPGGEPREGQPGPGPSRRRAVGGRAPPIRRPSPRPPWVLRRWPCSPMRPSPQRPRSDRRAPAGRALLIRARKDHRRADRRSRNFAAGPPRPRRIRAGARPRRPARSFPGPNAGRPPRLDRGPADRLKIARPAAPRRPAAPTLQRGSRGQRPAADLRPAQATLGSPNRRTRRFAGETSDAVRRDRPQPARLRDEAPAPARGPFRIGGHRQPSSMAEPDQIRTAPHSSITFFATKDLDLPRIRMESIS